MKGECLQKGRRKLPDRAIARPKEVDGLVLTWPNQPGCFVDGGPQRGFRDVGKTDGPHGRIVNSRVEQHLTERPEHPQLLIGRAGHGLAQLFEFPAGSAVVLP